MSSSKKAIYLKVNRREEYTFYNLKKWLDISEILDADIFVMCDNKNLQDDIFSKINLAQRNIQFLRSFNTKNIKAISKVIANDYWQNAAHAHLTTFFHAKENGYEHFWNIDADDTLLCLETNRCAEIFEEVERYCIAEETKCMSLDMWYSLKKGTHWSFGVTFTRDSGFWCDIILRHYADEDYKNLIDENYNIDCFFTYLRRKKIAKIETYYFENLEFIHYGNNMIMQPTISWYCRWHEGKIIYPIICACLGLEELGIIPIDGDVIGFDIGITLEEVRGFLASHILALNIYTRREWENAVGNQYIEKRQLILEKKRKLFVNKYNRSVLDTAEMKNEREKEIVIWGCGDLFHKLMPEIMKTANIRYICDNSQEKWGSIIEGNIRCISPYELSEMQNVFVILCVEKASMCLSIINQLIKMGITGFEHIDNWFEFIEK